MRKPKTPLLSFLQKCLQSSLSAEDKTLESAEGIQGKKETLLYNRRQFFAQTAKVAAIGGLLLSFADEATAQKNLPTVAIVGGGIAGLNAAYQLRKQGFKTNVKIYEGSSGNSWGRIQTKNLRNGITAELGGEFIDSGHTDMLQLAKEFNLPILDTLADGRGLIRDSYYINGRHYSEKEVVAEFRNFSRKIEIDHKVYKGGAAGKIEKLDTISIENYLKENLRISGWIYDLLNVAYTSEFGLEIGEQSALNFITMIGTDVKAGFKIFGESDERFKIKGGNGKIINRLKKILENQIESDRQLVSLRQDKSRKYTLSFSNGRDVSADFVVLAVPFTTLRNVEFSEGLFTPKKIKAINELGYGSSSKLLLETKSRVWREQKRVGYLFNNKVHNGWDFSQGQNGDAGNGGYTAFLGGGSGRVLSQSRIETYTSELNRVFPDFKNAIIGSSVINWSENPLVKGGYACYKVGQWTSISGEEIKPQGNVLFCGEHCSSDYQGYMNGGAETGRQAAQQIIKKLKIGQGKQRKVI